MRRRSSAVLLVAFAACLTAVSCAPKTMKVDATTQATAQYPSGDRGKLPPPSDDYRVLGVKQGIKGWVVQYDDKVFRGGEFFSDSAAKALRGWDVKTVVSVTPNDKEREFCRKHGLDLVEVPFDKTRGPSSEDLRCFLEAVREKEGPVYVHCVGGTHRGGLLGFAYRLHVLNWTEDRALVEYGRLGGDLKDDHNMLEAVLSFKP